MYSRIVQYRTFKNFGHKRIPITRFTFFWQGFLTFTFIGMGIEWKRMAKLLFGEKSENQISPVSTIEANSKAS